jgi:hypothetical protein
MDLELSSQAEQYRSSVVADGLFSSQKAALEAAVEALRERTEPLPFVPDEHMARVEQAIESADFGRCRELPDADWENLRQIPRQK